MEIHFQGKEANSNQAEKKTLIIANYIDAMHGNNKSYENHKNRVSSIRINLSNNFNYMRQEYFNQYTGSRQ